MKLFIRKHQTLEWCIEFTKYFAKFKLQVVTVVNK